MSGLRNGFDFDFNILTAFIRLGRAGPEGAGGPPYYYLMRVKAAKIPPNRPTADPAPTPNTMPTPVPPKKTLYKIDF
jgi:hypothetical protein